MAQQRRKHSGSALIAGAACVLIGLGVLVARIIFVRWGILYGPAAVAHVDAIVGALVVVGLAAIVWGWSSRKSQQTASSGRPDSSAGARWTDWASGLTALAGAGALVVSLMNLLEPLTPPRLATQACPGARVNNVPYSGTTGADGVNSRTGPARFYVPDGRFPPGCSIGFDIYCLGDPIEDKSGTTSNELWVTSRWLRVAKQPGGWRSFMARILSGESTRSQFISDAFIMPETAYDSLPPGKSQCPSNFPYPGRARLSLFNAKEDTFTAIANHAVNMGFAVWVPPGQGFLDADSYLQLLTPGTGIAHNPGMTSPNGTKSVWWPYKIEQSQLRPPAHKGGLWGNVVIMAIPCLADNFPAKTNTAVIASYRVPSAGFPVRSSVIPKGIRLGQLARAACEAQT